MSQQCCNAMLCEKSSLWIVSCDITFKLPIICNLANKVKFTRNRTNSRPAEKFDRTIRSHGTVQYFCSRFTRNWRASSGFTICPYAERYFSKSEMTSPNWNATHPRTHAFDVQKFRRSWHSQRSGQIFDRTSKKFDLHFGLQIFWTARHLNFRTVSEPPCERKT